MKKKVLIVCTTASMVGNFNIPNIRLLKRMGYDVEVACNFKDVSSWSLNDSNKLKKLLEALNVKCFQIDFVRSPFKILSNCKAYKELNKIIMQRDYNFIHCHTPIAGALTRLSAKRNGVKVIYTAHGFHFFKGGPLKNWIIYYPIEKWLSSYTDILITINNEDYLLAKDKMNSNQVFKINGAGVDINRFRKKMNYRKEIREKLNISDNQIVLLSVGELNRNKNHKTIIEALGSINNRDLVYVIAGVGSEKANLISLSKKNGIEKSLKLIGYVDKVEQIYSAADIFVFPSKREGLSFAGIEAMSAGLPIVGSNIRGVKDYILEGRSGFLLKPNDYKGFADKILFLARHNTIRKKMGAFNEKIANQYDISNVNKKMFEIYMKMADCKK
ncbi:capsular polysaccharide biosynthesis protein [Limosilactobacillus fermentum]|uniref:glycosyltransferase family 4 protein n=1 Tax=Limosilactobacillus fermentum TaxID=1613 RepID=UPI00097EECEB|nr:glycosyltransferase family 4 protein [Limosilactobacillus fermentum]SJM45261.1 capsular polysaccharide biosynthesis protein [Limosilactobacillus fermentum]SJM52780.1 capsular polysaccharide biosynthesis protein [Limosilactobacillus fermentum]